MAEESKLKNNIKSDLKLNSTDTNTATKPKQPFLYASLFIFFVYCLFLVWWIFEVVLIFIPQYMPHFIDNIFIIKSVPKPLIPAPVLGINEEIMSYIRTLLMGTLVFALATGLTHLSIKLPYFRSRLLVGIWIFSLYIMCVSWVFFSLSTSILQEKIEEAFKNRIDKTVAGINIEYTQWRAEAKKKEKAEVYADELEKLEKLQEQKVNNEKIKKRLKYLETLRGNGEWGSKPQPKDISNYSPGAIQDILNNNHRVSEHFTRTIDKIQLINDLVRTFNTKYPKFKIDIIKNEDKETAKLITKTIDIETAKKNLKDTSTDEMNDLAEIKFEIGNLTSIFNNENKNVLHNKVNDNSFDALFQDIYAYESVFYFINSLFDIPYWAIPKPILQLNLVIFMGMLGSLIFVTIEFIKPDDVTKTKPNICKDKETPNSGKSDSAEQTTPAGESDSAEQTTPAPITDIFPQKQEEKKYCMYFLRPFLGMIVALSIYVMIKSGQVAFLGEALSKGDKKDDLSPFFLSFVGIISGLLAEQAYKRMITTGKIFLSPEDLAEAQKRVQSAGN